MYKTIVTLDSYGEIFIKRPWFRLRNAVHHASWLMALFLIFILDFLDNKYHIFGKPQIIPVPSVPVNQSEFLIKILIILLFTSLILILLIMTLLNHTQISSSKGKIHVKHYPLATLKNTDLTTGEISKLYIEAVCHEEWWRKRLIKPSNNSYLTYGLYAETVFQEKVLLCEFNKDADANQAEQLIGSYIEKYNVSLTLLNGNTPFIKA